MLTTVIISAIFIILILWGISRLRWGPCLQKEGARGLRFEGFTSSEPCPPGLKMYSDAEGKFFCTDGTYNPDTKTASEYKFICGLNDQANIQSCKNLYDDTMKASSGKCPIGFSIIGQSLSDLYCCNDDAIEKDPGHPLSAKCNPKVGKICSAQGVNEMNAEKCDVWKEYECPIGYTLTQKMHQGKTMNYCKSGRNMECIPTKSMDLLSDLEKTSLIMTPQFQCSEVIKAGCPLDSQLMYSHVEDTTKKTNKIKICNPTDRTKKFCVPQSEVTDARKNYNSDYSHLACI